MSQRHAGIISPSRRQGSHSSFSQNQASRVPPSLPHLQPRRSCCTGRVRVAAFAGEAVIGAPRGCSATVACPPSRFPWRSFRRVRPGWAETFPSLSHFSSLIDSPVPAIHSGCLPIANCFHSLILLTKTLSHTIVYPHHHPPAGKPDSSTLPFSGGGRAGSSSGPDAVSLPQPGDRVYDDDVPELQAD